VTRHVVEASGRHLLNDEAGISPELYTLMGFVSQRLMIYADIIEVTINDTVVLKSSPQTWRTEEVDCPPDAR